MKKINFYFLVGLFFSVAVFAGNLQRPYGFRPGNTKESAASLPQASEIVFQQNFFDGDTTPQVGSATYTRTGSITVPITGGEWQEFAANALPIGVMRQGGTETLSGAYFQGAITNNLVRSEEFENASWTSISSGSGSAGTADSPLTGADTLADTISGSGAASGLQQATAKNASNSTYVFSIFLKSSSGTPTVKLIVKDQGTQSGVTDCVLSTTWDRCQVSHDFVSGTSTVDVQILVGATSNVRAWGAQLEEFASSGTSRARYGSANYYVRTTNAAATAGNSSYIIPNAIATQMATTGSFCGWVHTEVDVVTDLYAVNEPPYLFSTAGEVFAVQLRASHGPILFLNSTSAAQNLPGGRPYYYSLPSDEWTHLCFTWDTDADVYKYYEDGVLTTSHTPSIAAINFTTNTINLGGYNSPSGAYGLDGILSQAIFWKNDLSANEIASVYALKSSVAKRSEPGTGKIFEVSLGTSIIPTTGDKHFRYNARGNGQPYYYDSTSSIVQSSMASYPIPAYALGAATSKSGMAFFSRTTNQILQSEAPATTWTAVGTATVMNSVGSFLTNLTYGTILGISGDGIQQSSTLATASSGFNASVYASVAAGTLGFTITLEGDSGGTPDTKTSSTFTATTTPQRFSFGPTDFASGATGNCRMKILLTGAGMLRIGGMMLEKRRITGEEVHNLVGNYYLKTTTATVQNLTSNIVYRGLDSINPKKGTLIAWGNLYAQNPDDFYNGNSSPNGPTILGMPGGTDNFYMHMLGSRMDNAYMGRLHRENQGERLLNRNTWYHYAWTWEVDEAGTAVTQQIFVDGVQVSALAESGTFLRALKKRRLLIGGDENHVALDTWQGIIDRITIYGSALTDQEIEDDYVNTGAAYGK